MAAAAAAAAAAVAHTIRSSAAAPFLMKTYELVEDGNTDDVISWNETGTTFVVWKSAEFARDLLPTYFKHNNFSSFVRQLNTYGFRKIVPERWEFANDFFKRGEKELLSEIHRRKSIIPAAAAAAAAAAVAAPSTPHHQVPSCSTAAVMTSKSKGCINNNNNNIDHPYYSSLSNYSDGREDHLAGSTSTTTTTTTSFPLVDTNSKVVLQAAAATTSTSDMETTTTTTTTTSTDLSINLTGENEKLRKHNHILSLELSRIKKQCQDLMSFLSTACNYDIVKDNNLLIHDMIHGVSGGGPNHDSTSVEICCSTSTDHHQDNMDDDDENDEECRLKLFGVWLKGNNKKRVRRVARKTPTSQNRG